MPTTIVYHDNCHDGITALWAALQRVLDADPYVGKYDEQPDLERLRGRDVVFVDFCWRRAVMLEVRKVARSVLVLDHHETAMNAMNADATVVDMREWSKPLSWERHLINTDQDAFEGACPIYTLFDMNRSGAGITWDFMMFGQRRPPLIDYVEDRDLWRFKLPRSREVHASCGSWPLTLGTRVMLMTVPIETLAAEGAAILRYHDKLVDTAVAHAGRAEIGGFVVPAVACPNIELASDIGNKLAVGAPFAAVYADRPDGTRYYSLRSVDGGEHVGEVAKKLGGGGHEHAAGFTTPRFTS